MRHVLKVRLLIALLCAVTAVTAWFLFFEEGNPARFSVLIVGGASVLIVAVILISTAVRGGQR